MKSLCQKVDDSGNNVFVHEKWMYFLFFQFSSSINVYNELYQYEANLWMTGMNTNMDIFLLG